MKTRGEHAAPDGESDTRSHAFKAVLGFMFLGSVWGRGGARWASGIQIGSKIEDFQKLFARHMPGARRLSPTLFPDRDLLGTNSKRPAPAEPGEAGPAGVGATLTLFIIKQSYVNDGGCVRRMTGRNIWNSYR